MARRRFTAEELHARLIVAIGIILAIVFAVSVISMLYALLFITQPMKQAPNDAAFIDLVSTLTVFLTGTLAGIVSANGLKTKPKVETPLPIDPSAADKNSESHGLDRLI